MPLVVTGLIILNVLVFVLPYLVYFQGPSRDSFTNFLMLGWKENGAIEDGEYYRLLTAGFLHGSIVHLFFNMYSLWVVGRIIFLANLPVSFSPLQFVIIYFASLLGGSLCSYWFNPSPSVGASGALLGLLGALLVLSLRYGYTGLFSNILTNLVILVVLGFTVGRIDNWGHLGGFLTGAGVSALYLFL